MSEEDKPQTQSHVVYDVGDLLDRMGTRIDAGFATVTAKLDQKADKGDLARINARLDEHGSKISYLQERQAQNDAISAADSKAKAEVLADAKQTTDKNQRRWNYVLSFGVVAVGAAGVLIQYLLH